MYEIESNLNKRGAALVEVEPMVSGSHTSNKVRVRFLTVDQRRLRLYMTADDARSLARSLNNIADNMQANKAGE